MSYYVDGRTISLDAFAERLQHMDLIPSQRPILDGIAQKMSLLEDAGMTSLADIRIAVKSAKSLEALSQASRVDPDYLNLLRRVVGGLFPKPRLLTEFDWLDDKVVHQLKQVGIKNTQHLFDAAAVDVDDLASKSGVAPHDLSKLAEISDLCRIQWVSPKFARAIVAAGLSNVSMVAKADPEILCAAIEKTNKDSEMFKGKVGLRDVTRLVEFAQYVARD